MKYSLMWNLKQSLTELKAIALPPVKSSCSLPVININVPSMIGLGAKRLRLIKNTNFFFPIVTCYRFSQKLFGSVQFFSCEAKCGFLWDWY